MERVLLLPIAGVDRLLLTKLSGRLSDLLHVPVSVDPVSLDPVTAFEVGRSQYNSTAILVEILKRQSGMRTTLLGVCNVDLFVPVLTYVFGEAQLDGVAAVLSTFRLDDRVYGLPPNQRLFEERSVKEAMHEIGHTLGLYHCHDHRCVMHSSTVVEEIDLKGERFCLECEHQALGTHLPPSRE